MLVKLRSEDSDWMVAVILVVFGSRAVTAAGKWVFVEQFNEFWPVSVISEVQVRDRALRRDRSPGRHIKWPAVSLTVSYSSYSAPSWVSNLYLPRLS